MLACLLVLTSED